MSSVSASVPAFGTAISDAHPLTGPKGSRLSGEADQFAGSDALQAFYLQLRKNAVLKGTKDFESYFNSGPLASSAPDAIRAEIKASAQLDYVYDVRRMTERARLACEQEENFSSLARHVARKAPQHWGVVSSLLPQLMTPGNKENLKALFPFSSIAGTVAWDGAPISPWSDPGSQSLERRTGGLLSEVAQLLPAVMASIEEIDSVVLSIHRDIANDQDLPPQRRTLLTAIEVHTGRKEKDNYLAFSIVTPTADLLDLSVAEQRFETLAAAIDGQRAETVSANEGRRGVFKQRFSIFVNIVIHLPFSEGSSFAYEEISDQIPIDVKPGSQAFAAKCTNTLIQGHVNMIQFQYGESTFYLADKHVQAIVGDQGVILTFDQLTAEEPRPQEAAISRSTTAAVALYTDALVQYSAVTERLMDLVYANSTDGLQTTLIELKSVTANPLLLGPLIMARLMGDGTGATEAEIWRLQNTVLDEFAVTYDAADVSTSFDSIRRVLKTQKLARDKAPDTDAYDLAAWNKWMISGVVREAMISAGFRQFIMLEENSAVPGACIGDHFKSDQKLQEFKARIIDFVRKNPLGQTPAHTAGASGFFTQGQRAQMQNSAERSKGREPRDDKTSSPMQVPSSSDIQCRLHLSSKYRNDQMHHTMDVCTWWAAFKHQSGIAPHNHDKALATLHAMSQSQRTKISALKGQHNIAGKTVNLDHVIEAHLKAHAEKRADYRQGMNPYPGAVSQPRNPFKHSGGQQHLPSAKKSKVKYSKEERQAHSAAKALAAASSSAPPAAAQHQPQPQFAQHQQQAFDASVLQQQFLGMQQQPPPRMPPMYQGHVQNLMQPQHQFGQQMGGGAGQMQGGGAGQMQGGGAGQISAQQAYAQPQMAPMTQMSQVPQMPNPNQLRQGWHTGASCVLASATPASAGAPTRRQPKPTRGKQGKQDLEQCQELVHEHNRRQFENLPDLHAPWMPAPTYVDTKEHAESPCDIIQNLLQKIESMHVDNAQTVKTMELLQKGITGIPLYEDLEKFPRALVRPTSTAGVTTSRDQRKSRSNTPAKKGAAAHMIRATSSTGDGLGRMFDPFVEKGSGVAFLAHSQVSATDRSSVFQDPQQFNYWNQSSIDPRALQALVVQSCPPGNCIALVAKADPASLTTEGTLVQAALSRFPPMRADALEAEHNTRKVQIIETVHQMMQACNMPPVVRPVRLSNPPILPAALDSGVTTAAEALRGIDIMLHGAAMYDIHEYSTQPTTMTDGSVITDVNVGDGNPQPIVGRVGMTIQLTSYVQSASGPQTGRVVATFASVQASLVPGLICTLVSTSLFTEAGCAYTEWPSHFPAPNNAASVHTLDGLAASTGSPPTMGDPILRAFQSGPGSYSGIKLVGLKIIETYPPSFDSPRLLGVQIVEPSAAGVSTLAAHIAMEKSRSREVANFRQGRSS